jgi:hypothetical protein
LDGALADLLLVDGDPIANINLVADPDKNFVVIMKDGRVYKKYAIDAEIRVVRQHPSKLIQLSKMDWWIQWVDATLARSLSAGISKTKSVRETQLNEETALFRFDRLLPGDRFI